MPASLAISRTVVAWNPFRAKISAASLTRRCRRPQPFAAPAPRETLRGDSHQALPAAGAVRRPRPPARGAPAERPAPLLPFLVAAAFRRAVLGGRDVARVIAGFHALHYEPCAIPPSPDGRGKMRCGVVFIHSR